MTDITSADSICAFNMTLKNKEELKRLHLNPLDIYNIECKDINSYFRSCTNPTCHRSHDRSKCIIYFAKNPSAWVEYAYAEIILGTPHNCILAPYSNMSLATDSMIRPCWTVIDNKRCTNRYCHKCHDPKTAAEYYMYHMNELCCDILWGLNDIVKIMNACGGGNETQRKMWDLKKESYKKYMNGIIDVCNGRGICPFIPLQQEESITHIAEKGNLLKGASSQLPNTTENPWKGATEEPSEKSLLSIINKFTTDGITGRENILNTVRIIMKDTGAINKFIAIVVDKATRDDKYPLHYAKYVIAICQIFNAAESYSHRTKNVKYASYFNIMNKMIFTALENELRASLIHLKEQMDTYTLMMRTGESDTLDIDALKISIKGIISFAFYFKNAYKCLHDLAYDFIFDMLTLDVSDTSAMFVDKLYEFLYDPIRRINTAQIRALIEIAGHVPGCSQKRIELMTRNIIEENSFFVIPLHDINLYSDTIADATYPFVIRMMP